MFRLVIASVLLVGALAQYQGQSGHNSQNQINPPNYRRDYHPPAPVHYVNIGQNLAGDYKFGYDTGKGPTGQSFREEKRLPDGTVEGAYGILDEQGRQRIIKYRAGKEGYTATGDVGPLGAPGTFPGPAPQAPAAAAAPQYSAPQYSAPQYSAPQHAAPQYSAPAAQQYTPRQASNTGQWNPERDDPYYKAGPAFIDIDRLSYNIGTAKQG